MQHRPVPPAYPSGVHHLVPQLDELLFYPTDEPARHLPRLVSRRGGVVFLVDQDDVVTVLEVPRRRRDGAGDVVGYHAMTRQLGRLGERAAEPLDERGARVFIRGTRRRLV